MMPEKIDSKDVRLDVVDFIVAGKCLDESKGCSGTNKYDGATCLQIFAAFPCSDDMLQHLKLCSKTKVKGLLLTYERKVSGR